MMCYRDRTYCSFYKECAEGSKCGRALTPEVVKAADEWWGKPNCAPICEFVDEPECMVKK